MAGYYDFNANISFTFQAVKNLSAHSIDLLFALFCKFVRGFWVYLGINSFSQVKLMEIGNLAGRFDVALKLEFEVKSW